ncbi:MAG: hypothetical protein A3A24_00310 [Candidatus Buchananbacteria bacterium RIFCSPLOWO2_01_FULL_46_12]|uniref:Dickkopf N-terminal cysteine-rich domain-containing protein n=1 Tax=Candidatus Buchananbacteria bacterium RIFCSPLOWO2_01_FULL_46_12 TaxID=1797546 RepID=A0A1G1YMA4_9BACT|nr:MAG: hypothetical protein A3A24_00310 [Candidatus Buchananbacteria bacterium RIFCSPLOWO2_01_FULL_46_12]
MDKLFKKGLVIILTSLLFFSLAGVILAQENNTESGSGILSVPPQLSVPIGGFGAFSPNIDCSQKDAKGNELCSIPWIGQYIAVIFRYGIGLAAILATVMIMIGGFLWLSSAGSPDRVGKAKEFITSALLGLFLAMFSYLMLYTINPRLVASEPILVQKVTQVDFMCCRTAEGKFQMAGVSQDNKCPSGTEPVEARKCLPVPNQTCNPPSQSLAAGQCDNACKDRGGVRSNQPLLDGTGTQTGKYCCVCKSDSNCIAENGKGCTATANCCEGLICNTYYHECRSPELGGDVNCKLDSDCGPKYICLDVRTWNNCCKPLPLGMECGKNSDCGSGICNSECRNERGIRMNIKRCTATSGPRDPNCNSTYPPAPSCSQ